MGTEQGLLTLDNRGVCCVVQPSRRCQLKLNEVVGFGNQRVSHPSNGAAPPPKLRPSSPGYRQYVEAFLATQGGQSPRVEVRSVPHGSLVLVFHWPHSWGCGTSGEGGGQPAALFSQPKVSSPDLDPPPPAAEGSRRGRRGFGCLCGISVSTFLGHSDWMREGLQGYSAQPKAEVCRKALKFFYKNLHL